MSMIELIAEQTESHDVVEILTQLIKDQTVQTHFLLR